MSQLPLLDVAKLSKDLNLKNSAAEAAEKQSISATDRNRDSGQQAIIQHMGQVLTDAHTQVKQVLNNHVDKRTSIQQHIDIARRQNLADLAIVEVKMVLNETKEALVATQTRASIADRTLRSFKLRNDINRPANFPKWQIYHWGVVAVLLLVETVINGNFFAITSEGGLIGGFVAALTISVVNIGAGILGGMYLLPWWYQGIIITKYSFSRIAPPLATLALVSGMISFNLFVGHFRAQLEKYQEDLDKLAEAGKEAWVNFANNPLGIESFEAWVLVLLGILFSVGAWIEGYSSDDPIREYGRLTRLADEAEDANSKEKDKLRRRAQTTFEKSSQTLESAISENRRNLAEYEESLGRALGEVSEFTSWRRVLVTTTNSLLSLYQDFYLTVHQLNPTPTYFDEQHVFPNQQGFAQDNNLLAQHEQRLPGLAATVALLVKLRDEGIANQGEIFETVIALVDNFIAQTQRDAAQVQTHAE